MRAQHGSTEGPSATDGVSFGRFHFDDRGTEFGEQHGDRWTGDELSEVGDFDALEGSAVCVSHGCLLVLRAFSATRENWSMFSPRASRSARLVSAAPRPG